MDEEAALEQLASGGDDYQILFTAPAAQEDAVRRDSERRHIRVTKVGRVIEGQGLSVIYQGQSITPVRKGWTHD